MSEETYELCLDGDGLRIIPVGDQQVAVQILTEDTTDGILTDLTEQDDGLDSSSLFLSNSQSILVPSNVDLKQNLDKKTILEAISLYIEYGKDWIEDVLQGLSELQGLCDYPIYCCDGISWSNKLILGALSSKFRNLLLAAGDDSCFVIPQISKHELDTFTACLLNKSTPITKDVMKSLLKVGELFEFPIRYISLDGNNNSDLAHTVNYSAIFSNQREEFIQKISWQTDLAKLISKVSQFNHLSTKRTEKWHNIQSDNSCVKGEEIEANENRIDCVECGVTLSSETALQSHMDILHSNTRKQLRKTLRCPLCPKMFSFRVNVGKHVRLVHHRRLGEGGREAQRFGRGIGPVEVGRGKEVTSNPGESPSPAVLGPSAPSTSSMIEFLSPPGAALSSPSTSSSLDRSPNPVFKAPRIPKRPVNILPEQMDRTCNLCFQVCKNKRALVAHMQVHYGRVYKCEVEGCKASFTEGSKLRRHMVVHTGEKNFACDICGSKFTLRQNLKTHLRTHDSSNTVKNARRREVLAIDKVLVARLAKEEMQNISGVEVAPEVVPASIVTDDEPVDLSETTDEIEKFIAAMEGESER